MSRTIGTVLVNVEANTQKLVDGFSRAEKRVETATATMKSSITKLTTAYISFETVASGGRIFLDIVKNGIEVNRTMESLTNSLTRSSAVMMGNIDATGKAISTTEKYKLANIEAKNTLEQLQKANLETPHSLDETVKLYDSMYIGMSRAGATTSDMIEITKKLSIAVGNKVGFDAMLSAMDGLSTGTVEVSSDMGRFLNSIGLSNEAIKNSSNVIQLFKDKLSEFKAIDDFNTKLSNLTNSWDIFTANLSKPIFNTLENNFDGINSVIDRMNNGLIKTIVSLSTVGNLTEKSDLLLKRKLLLEEKKSISENKFMFDSEQKSKIQDINKELSILSGKLAVIFQGEDDLSNKTKTEYRDISTIISIAGNEQEKFNKKLEENKKKLIDAGATKEEINNFEKKSRKDFLEQQEKESKKTTDELKKQNEEINKALLDIKQIGMSEYESGLISITEKTNEWIKAGVDKSKVLEGEKKLLAELNSKTLFEVLKDEISFYQKKVEIFDDSIQKELELQGIAYANSVLDIENSNKSIEAKEKLIQQQTELYDLYVKSTTQKYNLEFENTMSSFYDDMLDSQLALNDAVFDFGSGFDGVSSKIGNVSKSLAAMSSLELTNKKEASKLDKKYIEQFNKYAGDVTKTGELAQQYEKDTAILKEQNIQAQIAGYANIAGAMSGMFAQGSREAASFQLIEGGLALASGIRAILTQGSGDPYTAFARMAAMAATVSSMLGNIGIAFGMNTKSTSSDAFSAMTANDGSGSTLGDSKAASKSITDSLSTLKDFAQPQFQVLNEMNKSLASIDSKIGGVSSLLIQNGGFAFGEGYTGFDTGYKNNISLGGLEKLNLFDALTGTNIMGGITNSIIGGLFGKTSVSQSLTDSGIYFADTLLTAAINQFNGEAYQTIKTTTSSKSWFSSSESSSISSYFDELDSETERQFSLVLDNLYSTVLLSGTALDSASADTARYLSNFVISLGKISLKDKTGTQIQEELTSVFGKVSDDITKAAFPALSAFQQVGEGLFSTMSRVATGMETAEYYIGRLGNKFTDITYTAIGNKQGDVGFEALLQSIEKVEKATYPVNNNLLNIVDNLDATAEELYAVYTSLDELRDRLVFIGQSALGISSSMIKGAGSVDSLNSGFSAYFEKFLTDSEQLTYKTQQIIKDFNNLGLALPVSKDSFKALLSGLDLTSEAGQELYGRLISLSESFADVADSTATSITELTTSLSELSTNGFDTFTSSLDSVGQSITAIKQTALGFINGFSTSSSTSLKDQLISYNKLRDQFGTYFDNNGIIKAGVNKDTVSGLYSQITSLASNISGKDEYLKNSLISQVSSDLIKFNSAEDILKVNIVDGLGTLLGLNQDQVTQLKTAVSDGKLTNTELNSIGSLSANQLIELIKVTGNGIKVTDAQIAGLSSLSNEQKAELIKANTDGKLTTAELQAIKGLTNSNLTELMSVDTSLTSGIKVTDAQIAGLSSLSSEQKAELIKANADGKLTVSELSSINGLTQTQKDGVIDFATKSSYFSTEGTLSDLATYSKLQLEAFQKSQAEETVGLSRQTLTYGDYIGNQEKIDIAKTLGISYDSAKPLIESLQNLSVSTNPTANIQSLLGFTSGSTSYNTTVADQLTKLSPYIGSVDVKSVIGGVSSSVDFNKRVVNAESAVNNALQYYNASLTNKNNALSSFSSIVNDISKVIKDPNFWTVNENITTGQPYEAHGYWTVLPEYTAQNNAAYNSYLSAFNNAQSARTDWYNAQASLKALRGYATGGYTGDIPVNAIAGFVHGGEHVLDSNITSQINSIGSVTDMVNQYTNTNLYEKMNSIFASMENKISDLVNITIAQANEMKKLRKEVELKGAI